MKRDPRPVATQGAIRPRDDVREMFDRIVPRYDLMNRLMTGGRDVAWRRLAVREALRGRNRGKDASPRRGDGHGRPGPRASRRGRRDVVGLDFSAAMLAAAARKEAAAAGDRRIAWVEGDAMALPFPDASFDAVTVAFGLRNMPSYPAALREMARVLRPGGMLVCLETTPLTGAAVAGGVRLVLLSRRAARWRPAQRRPGCLPLSARFRGGVPGCRHTGPDDARGRFSQVRYLRLGVGTVALHVAPSRARAADQRSSPVGTMGGMTRGYERLMVEYLRHGSTARSTSPTDANSPCPSRRARRSPRPGAVSRTARWRGSSDSRARLWRRPTRQRPRQ